MEIEAVRIWPSDDTVVLKGFASGQVKQNEHVILILPGGRLQHLRAL